MKTGTAVVPEEQSSRVESRLDYSRLGDKTSLAEDPGPRLQGQRLRWNYLLEGATLSCTPQNLGVPLVHYILCRKKSWGHYI